MPFFLLRVTMCVTLVRQLTERTTVIDWARSRAHTDDRPRGRQSLDRRIAAHSFPRQAFHFCIPLLETALTIREIPAEFTTERDGKTFVLYKGLLNLAHEDGLSSIKTTLVQLPSDANGGVAVVEAEVVTGKGTFKDIGDASPQNVNRMIAPHLIRMASTRAKARALRDAVNVGMTALEELGDEEDHSKLGSTAPSHFQDLAPRKVSQPEPEWPQQDDAPPIGYSSPPPMTPRQGSFPATEGQMRAIYAISKSKGIDPPPGFAKKDVTKSEAMEWLNQHADKRN